MAVHEAQWQTLIAEPPVAVQSGSTPFLLAREILRGESELTVEQFAELDGLFRAVSQAQFAALTEDPAHQAALRRYEALSWRQGSAGAFVVSLLILIGAAGVTLFTLAN